MQLFPFPNICVAPAKSPLWVLGSEMESKGPDDGASSKGDFLAANAMKDGHAAGAVGVSQQLVNNAETVAEFLSAIGNGKRLAIMCHLLAGELSVSEIAVRVDLSQSALSQHLAKLRSLGLVETRRERQMIFYSCKSPEVRQILSILDDLFGACD